LEASPQQNCVFSNPRRLLQAPSLDGTPFSNQSMVRWLDNQRRSELLLSIGRYAIVFFVSFV
jgi:hypothetical protein